MPALLKAGRIAGAWTAVLLLLAGSALGIGASLTASTDRAYANPGMMPNPPVNSPSPLTPDPPSGGGEDDPEDPYEEPEDPKVDKPKESEPPKVDRPVRPSKPGESFLPIPNPAEPPFVVIPRDKPPAVPVPGGDFVPPGAGPSGPAEPLLPKVETSSAGPTPTPDSPLDLPATTPPEGPNKGLVAAGVVLGLGGVLAGAVALKDPREIPDTSRGGQLIAQGGLPAVIRDGQIATQQEAAGWIQLAGNIDRTLKPIEAAGWVIDRSIDVLSGLTGPPGKAVKDGYTVAKNVGGGVGNAMQSGNAADVLAGASRGVLDLGLGKVWDKTGGAVADKMLGKPLSALPEGLARQPVSSVARLLGGQMLADPAGIVTRSALGPAVGKAVLNVNRNAWVKDPFLAAVEGARAKPSGFHPPRGDAIPKSLRPLP